jgi:hypothetical protein
VGDVGKRSRRALPVDPLVAARDRTRSVSARRDLVIVPLELSPTPQEGEAETGSRGVGESRSPRARDQPKTEFFRRAMQKYLLAMLDGFGQVLAPQGRSRGKGTSGRAP